jgi:hypothetical protein
MPRQWTGPVYDSRGDRLLAVETPFAVPGFGGSGQVPTLWIGNRTDGWTRRKGPVVSAGTTELFVDIYGPVWSSPAFLAAVLTLACLYVRHKDF